MSGGVPHRRATIVALALAALAFGCLKDGPPTGVDANSVRIGLRAQVAAGAGSTLHVQVYYLDQPATPVFLFDKTQSIDSGTTTLPLTVNLSSCLTDKQRVTGGSTCSLIISLALRNNGTLVDSLALPAVSATPGQIINVTPSITLSGTPGAVATVVVTTKRDSIYVGDTTRMIATAYDSSGRVVPNVHVVWTIDPTVGTIDSGGLVTGTAPGTTFPTADYNDEFGVSTEVWVLTHAVVQPAQDTFNLSAAAGATFFPTGQTYLTASDTTPQLRGLSVGTITYGASEPTGWLQAQIVQNLGSRVVPHKHGITMGSKTKAPPAHPSGLSATINGVRAQVKTATGMRVPTGRRDENGVDSTPGYLSVNVDSTKLPPGTYHATVPVFATGTQVTNVTVILTLTAAPLLGLTPDTLTFQVYAQGALMPPAQNVTYTNTSGVGTLGTISVPFVQYGAGATNWLSTAIGPTIAASLTSTAFPLGTTQATAYVSAQNAANNNQFFQVQVNAYVTFTKVVTGNAFACGLTTVQTVYCWGDNTYGQLGQGTAGGTSAIPVYVNVGGLTVNDVEVGGRHVCALDVNTDVWCWGDNTWGQVGVSPAGGNVTSPALAQSTLPVAGITLGDAFTCALDDGIGLCWGNNQYGQLGNGSVDANPHPAYSDVAFNMTAIFAGAQHACGVNGGQLICWGSDSTGQLGDGQSGAGVVVPTPVTIPVLNTAGAPASIIFVTGGGGHTCAYDVSGFTYCWGDNTHGQLGIGTSGSIVSTPQELSAQYTAISAGANYTCGTRIGAKLYCWGANANGQLGNGDGTGADVLNAQAITATGVVVTQIAAGAGATGMTTCFVTQAPLAQCTGNDSAGQLGDNPAGGPGTVFIPQNIYGEPAPAGLGGSRVKPLPPVMPKSIKGRPATRN